MFGMRKGTPEGVFKTLRNALDKRDLKYEIDEDNQAIGLSVMGDDLPIPTMIQVNDNHIGTVFHIHVEAAHFPA